MINLSVKGQGMGLGVLKWVWLEPLRNSIQVEIIYAFCCITESKPVLYNECQTPKALYYRNEFYQDGTSVLLQV
jgi:hypothetical protein